MATWAHGVRDGAFGLPEAAVGLIGLGRKAPGTRPATQTQDHVFHGLIKSKPFSVFPLKKERWREKEKH